MRPLGYLYLVQEFKLQVCDLLLESYVCDESQNKIDVAERGERRYYSWRRITEPKTWQQHLLFAIKYEGVNFEVLKALFSVCEKGELELFIASAPTGSYHRRIWFLFECLTGERLSLPDAAMGNYVPVLDDALQFALPIDASVREKRYRVNNNLPGTAAFCPYVRRTQRMDALSSGTLKGLSEDLLKRYPADLLYRATQYLYVKETKSSFAIERETPTQKRTMAFVSLLNNIPMGPLTKESLADVQNRVVDERYAQRDWRSDQVYVGETLSPTHEKVHFIAVKPGDLPDVMDGYLDAMRKLLMAKDVDPVLVAVAMSFAFVFIHPFDDGNGRTHRYIMHYVLARMGFVPNGLIFPVSAVLLKRQREYDRMLETFSERVMKKLDYAFEASGELSVQGESVDYYRYIDYTPIVEAIQGVIRETIETEWKSELDYLMCYDRIREGMRQVVDMPEVKANLLISCVNQNNGKLSNAKRAKFPELTDAEIAQIEEIISREMVEARKGVTGSAIQ